MKSIILFGMIALIAGCNNEMKTDEESRDTVFDNETTANTAIRENMDSMLLDEKEKVFELIGKYTPKEVYFEILLREKKRANDTIPTKDSLPSDIWLNYTSAEIAYITEKVLPLKSLSNIQLLSLYNEVSGGRKVIYGVDDRLPVIYDTSDIVSVTGDENPFMQDGKCVVALIPKGVLYATTAGDFMLQPIGNFKAIYNLCATERFLTDPVAANCSGFAVSEDKIVTAGHCINEQNYRGYYFVFDYMADSAGKYARRISASKVYEATEFIAPKKDQKKDDEDFAVLRVNKTIPPVRISRINPNTNLSASTMFHVIGCPCGIPLKLALNANLRSNPAGKYFTITSDTYGGNSGSPVFNSETHMVEGILVRGHDDFKRIELGPGLCSVSIVCPFNGCSGEDVSKNSQYLPFIR